MRKIIGIIADLITAYLFASSVYAGNTETDKISQDLNHNTFETQTYNNISKRKLAVSKKNKTYKKDSIHINYNYKPISENRRNYLKKIIK